VHGYQYDLRNINDITEEKKKKGAEVRFLPRYILSSSNQYFNLLFQSLNLEDIVAEKIWKLLQRLPTNPELSKGLVSLDVVNTPNPNWDSLLDSKSVYKLLYALQIIESLSEVLETSDSVESQEEQKKRQVWRRRYCMCDDNDGC